MLLAVRIIYPVFIRPAHVIVAELPLILESKSAALQNGATVVPQKMFMFDPNLVTREQLLNLGFSPRTAGTLLKFRDKGFVFRQKKDLKKVYGVTNELYLNLEKFIVISANKKSVRHHTVQRTNKKIELNAADSLALLEIKGVGPSFAKRILKYRSILGGYVNVHQLKEVYGFTEEMFVQIEPQVSVDASLVTKININKDDFKTVNKHPYISYELCKLIFEKKRREIITPETLQALMNDEVLFRKLEPYISF